MEIATSTIFSPKDVKALQMAMLYKGKVPDKALRTRVLIGAVIFGITVVLTLPFGFENVGYGLVFAGLILFFYYFAILVPHFRIAAYAALKMKRPGSAAALYTLTFRDDELRVLNNEENIKTETSYPYRFLRQTVETGEYFLIFVEMEKMYAIEKAGMEDEFAREIHERMSSALGNKYIVAQY